MYKALLEMQIRHLILDTAPICADAETKVRSAELQISAKYGRRQSALLTAVDRSGQEVEEKTKGKGVRHKESSNVN